MLRQRASIEVDQKSAAPLAAQRGTAEDGMSEWQPIETAPKDQIVDLCIMTPKCRYRATDCQWTRHKNREGWTLGWIRDEPVWLEGTPTHWMQPGFPPLPVPPQGRDGYAG